jgi:hypothetical protein
MVEKKVVKESYRIDEDPNHPVTQEDLDKAMRIISDPGAGESFDETFESCPIERETRRRIDELKLEAGLQ